MVSGLFCLIWCWIGGECLWEKRKYKHKVDCEDAWMRASHIFSFLFVLPMYSAYSHQRIIQFDLCMYVNCMHHPKKRHIAQKQSQPLVTRTLYKSRNLDEYFGAGSPAILFTTFGPWFSESDFPGNFESSGDSLWRFPFSINHKFRWNRTDIW